MRNYYILVLGLAISPLISTAQNQAEVKVRYFEEDFVFGGSFQNVSANGRFAVGCSREFTGNSFMWDRETDEIKVLEGSFENQAWATSVADDGTVAGCFLDENTLDNDGFPSMIPGTWKDGVWTALPRKATIVPRGNGMDGDANYISPDGSIVAGYLIQDNFKYIPAIWKNGVLQEYTGSTLHGQGGFLYSVSDNAEVWAGKAEHEEGAVSPAVWLNGGELIRVDGETFDLDSDDYFYYGVTRSISPNGRYAGGYFDPFGAYGEKPFIWTQENGREYIAEGGMVSVVTDTGDAYGATGYMGSAFIYKNKEYQSLSQYMSDNYGYNGSMIENVLGVSKDESLIGGWSVYATGMGAVMQPVLLTIDSADGIRSVGDEELTMRVEGDILYIGESSSERYDQIAIYDAVGALIGIHSIEMKQISLPGRGVYVVSVSGNGAKYNKRIVVR